MAPADLYSCLSFSTWQQGDNPCETQNLNTETCCLAFRGDCSSIPRYNDFFNTTGDMLRLMNSTEMDFVWNPSVRGPMYNRTIYIAFNLQEINEYGPLITNWLADLTTIIQTRGLDIQLIMGTGGYLTDYQSLCESSTGCPAAIQTLMDYPWMNQCVSMDGGPFCGNFNIQFSSLSDYCDSDGLPGGYALETPYLFYEFAQEFAIQDAVNQFMACPKPVEHSTLASVRLTSNTDPENIQTFLPQESYVFLQNATDLFLEPFESDNVLFVFYDQNEDMLHIQVRSVEQSDFFLLLDDFPFPASTALFAVSYADNNLLMQNTTGIYTFTVEYSQNSLTLNPTSVLRGHYIATDFVLSPEDNTPMVIAVQTTQGCDGIFFSAFQSSDFYHVLYCLEGIQSFNPKEMTSGALTVELGQDGDTVSGLLVVSVPYTYMGQTKPTIFGVAFTFTISTEQWEFTIPSSYLGFGSNPFVDFVTNNGSLYVIEAHTDGTCPCGALINNGNQFKCGLPATINYHSAYLQSVKHMLNYNWGKYEDWVNRIQTGQYLGPCDPSIMHGKIGNGDYPDGFVYRNQSSGRLQAVVVDQHVPYVDIPTFTKMFCGANSPDGPIVNSLDLNIYDLVDFDVFDYLA